MVVQQAPARPKFWGYRPDFDDQIVVEIAGVQTVTATETTAPDGTPTWEAEFNPLSGPGPYTVTLTLGACSTTLNDVLAGDVWVCSGQSNMEHALQNIDDPEPEIADVVNYPNVRTFLAGREWSDTTLYDLRSVSQNWAVPTTSNIRGFSAVCWLFGRNLYQKLQRPIGLIETNWGGTRIEAWTSAEALPICFNPVGGGSPPNGPSQLYNAMIHPFLPFPIFGATWYQGESNQGNSNLYGCALKAMVGDWRARWFAENPSIDPAFPFGVVQLAPNTDNDASTGFPDVRWQQTDSFGYAPNANMNKFFLAVAVDLPDFGSPYGSIHPRYKRQIAQRLALGAFNVAYGQTDSGIFQGPIPTQFINEGDAIRVVYSVPLAYRATNGFELCCGDSSSATCSAGGQWVTAALGEQNTNDITLAIPCGGSQSVTGFRYVWRESPCPLEACTLYSVENDLPAPPFIYNGAIV
jgi:sialate O-acetylesterase